MTNSNFFFLALVGYRGCGKSWLGRQLAMAYNKQLSSRLALLSCDYILEKREEMSVTQMVEKKGWSYFREKEALLLKEIFTDPNSFFAAKKNFTASVARKFSFPFKIKGKEKKCFIFPSEKKLCIIDCGGGIVLKKENRELLKKNSKVIFLNTSFNVLLQRQLRSPRPSFMTQKKLLSLAEQKQAIENETRSAIVSRLPLYKEVANLQVDFGSVNKKGYFLHDVKMFLEKEIMREIAAD